MPSAFQDPASSRAYSADLVDAYISGLELQLAGLRAQVEERRVRRDAIGDRQAVKLIGRRSLAVQRDVDILTRTKRDEARTIIDTARERAQDVLRAAAGEAHDLLRRARRAALEMRRTDATRQAAVGAGIASVETMFRDFLPVTADEPQVDTRPPPDDPAVFGSLRSALYGGVRIESESAG